MLSAAHAHDRPPPATCPRAILHVRVAARADAAGHCHIDLLLAACRYAGRTHRAPPPIRVRGRSVSAATLPRACHLPRVSPPLHDATPFSRFVGRRPGDEATPQNHHDRIRAPSAATRSERVRWPVARGRPGQGVRPQGPPHAGREPYASPRPERKRGCAGQAVPASRRWPPPHDATPFSRLVGRRAGDEGDTARTTRLESEPRAQQREASGCAGPWREAAQVRVCAPRGRPTPGASRIESEARA